jgi:hypothetical protein
MILLQQQQQKKLTTCGIHTFLNTSSSFVTPYSGAGNTDTNGDDDDDDVGCGR